MSAVKASVSGDALGRVQKRKGSSCVARFTVVRVWGRCRVGLSRMMGSN